MCSQLTHLGVGESPRGESSMGQIVQHLGETSMGRNAQWVKRL